VDLRRKEEKKRILKKEKNALYNQRMKSQVLETKEVPLGREKSIQH